MHTHNGAQPDPVTPAQVLELAREVEALRGQLGPLDGLTERVTDLANTVADLADEVAEQNRRPKTPPARSWLDLPDGTPPDHADEPVEPVAAEEIEQVLDELVAWVRRVYLRYADAAKTLPECWLWHPDVIEELTWLRHAWRAAYRVNGAPQALAWDWHDRYRPGVVRRIGQLAGRCSLEDHTHRPGEQPAVHGPGGAPVVTGADGVGELASWWATGRQLPPPAPADSVIEHARAVENARLRQGSRR